MNWVERTAAAIVLLLAAAMPVRGQAPESANLRGESAQTRKRLAEAEQKLLAGKTADATDDLQRILDEAANDLVTLDGKQHRPARWLAHQILARLPADALKNYRDRIDAPAQKLLDVARKNRDPGPLWELLDKFFVSRPGDEALLLLGDLLFEKGDFRTAELVWRRLVPDAGADVAYPHSKAEPAAIHARLILTAIFQGDLDRARVGFSAFEAKYPNAKGSFAGKEGLYADTLRAVLNAPPILPLGGTTGSNWPTFGGGPHHSGRVDVRIPSYWPGRPTWTRSIFPSPHLQGPVDPPGRPPFGHPAIIDGQVFVTDGFKMYGYDILTGKSIAERPTYTPREPSRTHSDPCPALTASGGKLYVRIGPPPLWVPKQGGELQENENAIVCYEPRPGTKEGLYALWRVSPPTGEGKTNVAWEGAPLVAGRRMWVAYARLEGGRVVHGISCFDPADATGEPGRPAWSVDVCDSPLPPGTDNRVRQEIITLAGRNVVFCSNAGAVIALDGATGRPAWGFRYPRSRKVDANRSPHPAPAVVCGGRVFVAPADADQVYALDQETGALLWESGWEPGASEAAQIVGISVGKLIVATAGPTPARGIRALSVATGRRCWDQSNGGGLPSYGRGFVTDDAIVWPTASGVQFLDPHDGDPLLSRIPVTLQTGYVGNVVYADGVLVVVTPTEVRGYVSDRRLFGPGAERSERDPTREKFEGLIERAERAIAEGNHVLARATLLSTARSDLPIPFRAWAVARLLSITSRVDDEAKLPADVRSVLSSEIRNEWVIAPGGVPVTVETLLLRVLGQEPASPPIHLTHSALAADRTLADVPELSSEARISRTARLPPGSAPLRWIPGQCNPPRRLVVTTTSELLAFSLASGDKTRHEAVSEFTCIADVHEGFVAAGRFAVALYGAGRSPAWLFRVPTTDPLPTRAGEFRIYSDDPAPPAELSSFRLSGSWLVARLGDRHLIALDLHSRRVAWVLGSNGRPGFHPVGFSDSPRFGSEFAVTGRLLVVQLSDGRRWSIRVETGRILDLPGFGQLTTQVWWPHPPAAVDVNRLATSDGPGLVRLLNLITGQTRWTHRQNGEASLTGEPPQVRAWWDALFIAVRRNHGVEFERLSFTDGTATWSSGPAFFDVDHVNLMDADADTDRIYVPVGNSLTAIALKDGKVVWEVELPDTRGAGGWVVRAGRNCLIAYPVAAIPRECVLDVLTRLIRSFLNEPVTWRLPGLALGLYDAWVTRSCPILLLDPETGKRLGKITIPAAGPAVTACFEGDLAVIATGNRVCWLK